MRYCTACLIPDSRPNGALGPDGLCTACEFAASSDSVDFERRLADLRSLLLPYIRRRRTRRWDCIVGVSGGKDSTRQALWVREKLGLRPLLVCVAYPPRQVSRVGVRNLSNLTSLGFDVRVLAPAPVNSRLLLRESFLRFGNWAIPTEAALFAGVPQVAIKVRIPLVLWGENVALQVGDLGALGRDIWDGNNLRNMNTLRGGNIDWMLEVVHDSIALSMYQYPSARDLERAGVQTIFLGPAWSDWSTDMNSRYALTHGLAFKDFDRELDDDPAGTAAVDEDFVTVNQLIKYYKFGFARGTEYANLEIRSGAMSRDEAIDLVTRHDGQCSDELIAKFCAYIQISCDQFWRSVRNFTNIDLFSLDGAKPQPRFEVGRGVVR